MSYAVGFTGSLLLFAAALVLALMLFIKDLGFAVPGLAGRECACRPAQAQPSGWKLFLSITAVCFVTRLALLGVCGLVYVFANGMEPTLANIASVYGRMDGYRYLEIAQNGYTASGDYNKMVNLAFFPMYPLLVRLVSLLTGNLYVAAFLTSNLCLSVTCYYLYRLALLDYEAETARRSVVLLLVFPFSFFCSITYPESTFLMFSVLCAYCARRRSWLGAGIFGMLCAFTRTQGILMLAVCAYEYLMEMGIGKDNWREFFRRLRPNVCWLLLIPVGYLAYLGVNKAVTGDWFAFLTYQREFWGQSSFGFVPANIAGVCRSAFEAPNAIERIAGWGTEAAFIFFSLILLTASFKKIRTSYFIYMVVYLYVSFSLASLISAPRYLVGAFPLFLMLASWLKNRYAYAACVFVSAVLLCFYTVAFSFQWYIY